MCLASSIDMVVESMLFKTLKAVKLQTLITAPPCGQVMQLFIRYRVVAQRYKCLRCTFSRERDEWTWKTMRLKTTNNLCKTGQV